MKPLLILAADLVHCALLGRGHWSSHSAAYIASKLAALLCAEDTLGTWAHRLDSCRHEERRELLQKIFDDLRVRIAQTPDEHMSPDIAKLFDVYRERYPVEPAHVAMVAKFGRLQCGVVAYSFCDAKARSLCECVACAPRKR
jgi:hypothetical protein